MKKIIILALVLTMGATMLASCSTEKPSTEKTEPTTVTQTTEATKKDVALKDIYDTIAGAYKEEDVFANTEAPAELVEAEFPIDKSLYEEAVVYVPMMSTFIDRIAIFKAVDGKEADLLKGLEGVKETKMADTMQYPQNLAKIKSTQVVANGEYVAFLMCGAMNEDMDASQEDALAFAQKEVQKAVDAFNGVFE